jgi:hypothetical protein
LDRSAGGFFSENDQRLVEQCSRLAPAVQVSEVSSAQRYVSSAIGRICATKSSIPMEDRTKRISARQSNLMES